MENQKSCNIRFANDPGASGENSSSVIIRDIRGQKTSEVPKALALDSRLRLRGAVFARLQNWKGCEILAEALAECPSIEIHWYGADIGNTAEGGNWSESLARNFPKVFGQNFLYHGVVTPDRVPGLMAEADFVCVPSLWDVFNLSAVEAMESGKVVLCSRQAGAEMLIEDGVNGFLFDPDISGELAEKLKQIVQMSPEERERIGCVARESVRDKLQPERLIQQRTDYYRSVAAQKPQENRNCFLADILELKLVMKKTWGKTIYELRRKLGL
jgi:glycosyltransferase involved in cell wall biosynthesis